MRCSGSESAISSFLWKAFDFYAVLIGLLILFAPINAQAELHVIKADRITEVFQGRESKAPVFIFNSGAEEKETVLSTRLYQASSSTMAPLGAKAEWKAARVSAGQTIFEEFDLSVPETKTPTIYLLKIYAQEKEIGSVKIKAFPDQVWEKIAAFCEKTKLVMVDPENRLSSTLEEKRILFRKVEKLDEVAEAELVIAGPFSSRKVLSEYVERIGKPKKPRRKYHFVYGSLAHARNSSSLRDLSIKWVPSGLG